MIIVPNLWVVCGQHSVQMGQMTAATVIALKFPDVLIWSLLGLTASVIIPWKLQTAFVCFQVPGPALRQFRAASQVPEGFLPAASSCQSVVMVEPGSRSSPPYFWTDFLG